MAEIIARYEDPINAEMAGDFPLDQVKRYSSYVYGAVPAWKAEEVNNITGELENA